MKMIVGNFFTLHLTTTEIIVFHCAFKQARTVYLKYFLFVRLFIRTRLRRLFYFYFLIKLENFSFIVCLLFTGVIFHCIIFEDDQELLSPTSTVFKNNPRICLAHSMKLVSLVLTLLFHSE